MDLSTVKLETKNRSKTLVNVVETQNILLTRLVLKIEPEAEVIIGRDRYLELITSGSDLNSLSFSLLSVIHLSISATQCSTLDLDRPASTSRLVLNRGTQREYSSKPLKHSIVKRILVFKR